ncbi:metallophosphoesterase [Rivularia sp. UHCC 0363]|uniref:metallophosphoesterase family protein n=1 Tax=Rivularia sp. UHCC 0363 TaxID=3110244 RepID=UPI002B21398D|nr:metallophosphoesterase [Rivularia sp. UHCC 0363]MEA5593147.1 metallophosphoesterase [Rivularia sp. UHCC 0363]
MRRRRFFIFAILGLALSIFCFACTSINREATQTPQTPVTQQTNKPRVANLPPETEAIVKSAGANGLFDPPRGDVRLAVISDLNSAYGSTDYDPEVDKGINLLPFWQPDMVVCSGDMVAGQKPSLTEAQIKAMWAAFDVHVAAPLRKANLPYGFTVGNHDASSAKGVGGNFLFQQERDLASDYWNNPEHDPGIEFIDKNEFPFFYTFKHKDIFFMAWDGSSHIIPPEKLAWIEKALASPEAQQAKMRILLSHLPLYAVAIGRDQPGDVMENADQLRVMLEKNNVHTYISGHHHAYYPAHRGKLQLLHMGILGSGPRPLVDGNLPPTKAITVVDINFNSPELTTYTTYDIRTLKLIENEQLPRFLTGHNGIVLRRDVEYQDLKPEEKATCEAKIGVKLCTNQ